METGRMNAPSLSCRFAIAPFRAGYVGEEIETRLGLRHRIGPRRILRFRGSWEDISASLRAPRSNPSFGLLRHGLLRCARNDVERVERYAPSTSFCILPP